MPDRDWLLRTVEPLASASRSAAPLVGQISLPSELRRSEAQPGAADDGGPSEQQSRAISEAHYRAGFEFSNVGQVHFDPVSGAIIRVNSAYADMLGYRPEEMVGLIIRDLTYLEDHDPERYGQLLRGRLEAYTAEQRYVRRDGALVWGRFSVSMARVRPGGRAFLALALIENIDERYKAQMALKAAKEQLEVVVEQRTTALEEKTRAEQLLAVTEAQFRAGFESSAVGQVHFDPVSGAIIRVNPAFASMLGYRPEEVVGRGLGEFTYPEDRHRRSFEDDRDQPQMYRRLLKGDVDAYAREKRYIRRDGSLVWGRVSLSMARLAEGDRALLVTAIIEDIDDRHKAQLALVAAKKDLELAVEQRTEALEQRDVLLREVYHRVKNNLQVIDSLMLMQAQRLSDPTARAALEDMPRRIYALGLVHQQLMTSDDLETFDIGPFLQDLSRHLVEGVGGGDVSISVRAVPLKVGLDFAIPLGLLATELVTNSMKHAYANRSGNIHLTLENAENGRVALCVSDDGDGYDPATSRGSLGTVIIEGLVRQLKGEISVHADDGARTVVSLPAPMQI